MLAKISEGCGFQRRGYLGILQLGPNVGRPQERELPPSTWTGSFLGCDRGAAGKRRSPCLSDPAQHQVHTLETDLERKTSVRVSLAPHVLRDPFCAGH